MEYTDYTEYTEYTEDIHKDPYRQRSMRNQNMVVRHAQTQGVIMAEKYLSQSGSAKDQTCTQRSFCDIASIEETNDNVKSETTVAAAEAIR